MERITRFRAMVLLSLILAIMLFLGGRLYYLQIIETGGQVDNTTTFTTATRVRAARGSISDRNGNVLVGNRASYDLVLNHYVLTNSKDPNGSLLELVKLCREMGIKYNDHFPVSESAPFQYTLSSQSNTWQRFFQLFLESRDLDSDITAPLLFRQLRDRYSIPVEWSDEDARAVMGLRYELSLRTLDTGLSNFVFLADVKNDQLAAISELNVPGMRVEASTVREYYTKYAAHVLGYVGAMSPQQWEYYKTVDKVPDVADYLMDAEVGQAGFEAAFEEYLHGIDGWRYDEVTADGTVIKTWYDPAPIAGNNVEVTLNLPCQIAAEEEIARVFADLALIEGKGSDAEGGAVVAIDVKTGQVLACVSYPTYDLNKFFSDYDTLLNEELNPLLNRALMGIYPPGSTYKMTMVLAGIDNGYITPTTTIEDKGIWEVEAKEYFALTCLRYSSSFGKRTHGHITAAEALKCSCNYFFYQLGSWMHESITDPVAKSLGLGVKTGVELYEEAGYRANAETKANLYGPSGGYFLEVDRLQSSIGQSDNRFTPIQLCVYASSLANRGVRYKATFLNRVVSADYTQLIHEQLREIMDTMPMSQEAYDTILDGMIQVTSDPEGTAYSVFKDYPISVAAKTGTAQTGYTDASDNCSFVCFAPANDPQIAVAVYGERVGLSSVVAEIAKAVLDAYFGAGQIGTIVPGENQLG